MLCASTHSPPSLLPSLLHSLTAGKNQGLFNNAAQVWNHNFYWNCLKPNGGGVPTGKIAALIDRDLGGYEAFRYETRVVVLDV